MKEEDYLKVANCRGEKPVVSDIKKAYLLLDKIIIELNACDASWDIRTARDLLWTVIDKSGYVIKKTNNYLIKKK